MKYYKVFLNQTIENRY